MARVASRILFALTGAVFGAIFVSLAEAREAVLAAAHAPPFAALVLADLGVLAPIAVVVAVGVSIVSLFLEPGRPLAPAERIALARAEPVLARSRTAALAPLVCGALTIWTSKL